MKEGRRPKNRPNVKGTTRTPGWQPEETEALTAKAGYDCLNNATVPRRPEAVGGHPCWAGPLTTSLRGLWFSLYLPRAMVDRTKGRRP